MWGPRGWYHDVDDAGLAVADGAEHAAPQLIGLHLVDVERVDVVGVLQGAGQRCRQARWVASLCSALLPACLMRRCGSAVGKGVGGSRPQATTKSWAAPELYQEGGGYLVVLWTTGDRRTCGTETSSGACSCGVILASQIGYRYHTTEY